jgi:hypothetical protein
VATAAAEARKREAIGLAEGIVDLSAVLSSPVLEDLAAA